MQTSRIRGSFLGLRAFLGSGLAGDRHLLYKLT